jgi:hypothetical protein
LWTLTRPDWREDYPPLAPDLQTLLRDTSGQGRTETTTLPALETVPGAYVYDRRFAYAASCENLPAGPPERVRYPSPRPWSDTDRYVKGRYHISFRVPDDWQHLGLFMVKRPGRGNRWFYPEDPGGTYETWTSNGEIALAVARGWRVEVRESITFPHTASVPRPLDVWIKRLQKLWYEQAHDGEVQDAIRDIVIHTIGGFHSFRRRKKTTVKDTEPLPPDAVEPLWNPVKGEFTYTHWEPLPAKDLPYQHEHWSIEIWARARTRLLSHGQTGALCLPREHVLGLRVDALYLSLDPRWPDDGSIGAFRRKAARCGPLPAPHDAKSLRALADDD